MRCCVDLIKFILFIVNFLFFVSTKTYNRPFHLYRYNFSPSLVFAVC